MDFIEINGARSHNLKNISLKIPRDKLVVVTGLSGSGKSSLAFDTIYAEGQRRYMDTLSPYARQFMGMMERPQVDDVRGLSPIIAIEQKTTGRNPRSTVGTMTEIYDFFRLLYARASTAYSPATGKEMVKYTDDMIVDLIINEYEGQKLLLLAPVVKGRKGHYKDLFEQLIKRGYSQVRIDGEIHYLRDVEPLDRYKTHFIELVVDKMVPNAEDRKRIRSSVVTALSQGKGSIALLRMDGEGGLRYLSKNLICADTGISFPLPAPYTFSFNSPQGACPHCNGLGVVAQLDMDKVIPNDNISIADGGIVSLGSMRSNSTFDVLESIARKYGFSLHDPIKDIPPQALSTILYGSQELFRVGSGPTDQMVTFDGVLARTRITGEESEESLEKKDSFMNMTVCPVCNGTRLKKEALNFKIAGLDIAQVSAMDINELYDWIRNLPGSLNERQKLISNDILKELTDRVGFLKEVGLGYLSLDRPTATLSGGESQRIRLATQIGSKLVNVLYILDEPSIGLHQRDNRKLIDSLKKLRDEGNSVMVVEHDSEMMENADWLVDLGPGAGELGGELLYNGEPSKIQSVPEGGSMTIDYLLGRKSIAVPATRREGNGLTLKLHGARGNNLQDVDLTLPLGTFIGVSGVSGSGKSSLINETLMPILSAKLYRSLARPLAYDSIEGIENIDKVIEVDQSPIGRSPRSNPATYTNVFGAIRELFGQTPDAKIRGFKANRFSFNVKSGRCEVCKGAGIQEIEMHFLPPAHVTCKECGGKRYKPDTLAVHYKGKSISDVLDMTVSEAAEFFRSNPFIYPKLKAMVDVGLGYVRLGQPSTTLSGGESQRVKLAAELARKSTGSTLYLLDEPTTGLHFDDIKNLLEVLQKLVDQGNTVLIIEHNLDVLKSVDYLIDMGPEGGRDGGRIIAQGTPEQVAANPASYTGQYLKEMLG
ncbi:MAG: excinuclease ABC subunit UvrA [Bacteroidales bacterium]|nr:excinuclease ABC subunit UvrA [Bacteroidales bacterium]